jgi:hypothetical protein
MAVPPLSSREVKGGCTLASAAISTDLVNMIADEMASGVDRAVECWMSEIEQVLTDVRLTTLGRLNAVREIVQTYKNLTGKTRLEGRRNELQRLRLE